MLLVHSSSSADQHTYAGTADVIGSCFAGSGHQLHSHAHCQWQHADATGHQADPDPAHSSEIPEVDFVVVLTRCYLMPYFCLTIYLMVVFYAYELVDLQR